MVNVETLLSSIKTGKEDFSLSEKQISKSEEYLAGARKIKDISIETGVITGATKSYIYGYQDLSFDEFLSYIYWRTQIRKRKRVLVPGGFLALYLIEIVNFIEFDKVQDCLEMIEFLESLSLEEKSNIRQIKKAREEFVFFYASLEDAKTVIDFSEYEYLLEDDKIANKNLPSLLNCLGKRHYAALLKSKMYLQHPDELESDFYDWFYSLVDYLTKKGINYLELYYGNIIYTSMRRVYVKEIFSERIIKKEISFNEISIIKVYDEVELATKHFTNCTQQNKEHLYIRGVVTKYILRLYEYKMRKKLKFPKTFPTTSELQKGFCNLQISEHIEAIFNSNEFYSLFID